MKKKTEGKKRNTPFLKSLLQQASKDKKSFAVYILLHIVIVAVIVRNAVIGNFENVFTGALALVLLLIPPFVEKKLHVELPTTLEITAYSFVFCAEILGEIGNYYQRFPFWDSMLHTCNGFLFAAFGFCLVDILNKSRRFRFQLSPLFLCLVAFCFSMTIGVLWEFFEYGADYFLHTDMQKDFFVNSVNTVSLPNELGEKVTHIKDIDHTVIYTGDGGEIRMNGYLDIGIGDTMKDLYVNFIGAILFSIIGYFYFKHRGKGHIANQFIPVFVGNDAEQKSPHDAVPDGEMPTGKTLLGD